MNSYFTLLERAPFSDLPLRHSPVDPPETSRPQSGPPPSPPLCVPPPDPDPPFRPRETSLGQVRCLTLGGINRKRNTMDPTLGAPQYFSPSAGPWFRPQRRFFFPLDRDPRGLKNFVMRAFQPPLLGPGLAPELPNQVPPAPGGKKTSVCL